MTATDTPRILVVDDEKHVREAVFTWFSEHGFSVQVAENGARAVDLCAEETFDLVIMDLEMPVMKGPEAIKAIRATLPDLPIVVFSGFSTQTQEAVEMGANLILQKPLGLRELEREVREVLSV